MLMYLLKNTLLNGYITRSTLHSNTGSSGLFSYLLAAVSTRPYINSVAYTMPMR